MIRPTSVRALPNYRLYLEFSDGLMEITGISIVRVRDGRIVEAWNNFDFMSMFKQLGAL